MFSERLGFDMRWRDAAHMLQFLFPLFVSITTKLNTKRINSVSQGVCYSLDSEMLPRQLPWRVGETEA